MHRLQRQIEQLKLNNTFLEEKLAMMSEKNAIKSKDREKLEEKLRSLEENYTALVEDNRILKENNIPASDSKVKLLEEENAILQKQLEEGHQLLFEFAKKEEEVRLLQEKIRTLEKENPNPDTGMILQNGGFHLLNDGEDVDDIKFSRGKPGELQQSVRLKNESIKKANNFHYSDRADGMGGSEIGANRLGYFAENDGLTQSERQLNNLNNETKTELYRMQIESLSMENKQLKAQINELTNELKDFKAQNLALKGKLLLTHPGED